jgi:hypothetical protein
MRLTGACDWLSCHDHLVFVDVSLGGGGDSSVPNGEHEADGDQLAEAHTHHQVIGAARPLPRHQLELGVEQGHQ